MWKYTAKVRNIFFDIVTEININAESMDSAEYWISQQIDFSAEEILSIGGVFVC